MPEIRYYTITQVRDLKLWANSPGEAAQIADAIFHGEIKEGDITATHIIRDVRDRDLIVLED